MTLAVSLRSELLKIKRTSVLYLVLVTGFIVPFFVAFDHISPSGGDAPTDSWRQYYMEAMMALVFAFLPLFLVLISTLLMQIEARNNTWKQVVASPQSFFHILLAKFIVMQFLAMGVLVGFNLFIFTGAALLDGFMAGRNFLSYLDQWPEILRLTLLSYGSTLGVSGFAFWMALRSKNFIAPIGIGLVLWFTGPIAAFEFKLPHVDKFVFALPLTVLSKRFAGQELFHQLLSVGYVFLFFGIAWLEFTFQRIQPGPFMNRARNFFVNCYNNLGKYKI